MRRCQVYFKAVVSNYTAACLLPGVCNAKASFLGGSSVGAGLLDRFLPFPFLLVFFFLYFSMSRSWVWKTNDLPSQQTFSLFSGLPVGVDISTLHFIVASKVLPIFIKTSHSIFSGSMPINQAYQPHPPNSFLPLSLVGPI